MSHKSWLKSLLSRGSKSSPATYRKRPTFARINTELLEDRTAPATLTWTGAAGNNWNDAGNWTGGGVPSAVNNVLNFTAGASVAKYTSTNDIPGLTGMTINITDAVATAGSDFTINGTASIGITSLTNNKTDAGTTATTISVPLSGTAATITATAGEVAILNATNVFNTASTVNVPTGAIVDMSVTPSGGSLGSAKINVTGGKVVLTGPATQTIPNVLLQRWYFNAPALNEGTTFVDSTTGTAQPGGLGGMTDTPNAGLLTYGPVVGSKLTNTALSFANLAAFSAATASPLSGAAANFGDNFSFLWTGKFTAVKAGTYTFGAGQGPGGLDDEMVILIDLNDDGQFDNASERVLNSGSPTGCCGVIVGQETPTFTAGESHNIAIGFQEFGGGEVGSATFMIAGDATFGAFTAINPGAANQAGMWSYVGAPLIGGVVSNDVSISGSSTIEMSSLVSSGAKLGNLTMASGATLAVNGPGVGSTLTFGTASLAGDVTFNVGTVTAATPGASLRLSGQVTGAGGFTKTGAGTLTLDGANNNYAGATVVNAGTVVLGADSALGAITAGTTVNTGGQVALRANYNAAEPLNISGGATATVVNGFLGKHYAGTMNITSTLLPNSGINIGMESQRLVATAVEPRVDFGRNDDTFDTTTAAGYALVAGGPDGAPLDRGGPAGYPAYNAFGGVGVDPGSNDNIGGLWTGVLNVPATGTYRFTTRSDDGSRLWLDGSDLVVDNNFDQGMTNRSGDRLLTAGPHPIKIGFYEGGGGWGMQAFWARIVGGAEDPTFTRHIINDNVNDQGKAITHSRFGAAAFESAGTFNFNGPITLGGAAQISATSGTLTLNGGINNNGNALHFGGTGTVVVATTGISGSGLLRRLDGGATQLSVANTYSGGSEIENGRVLFANNLGTGATHVFGAGGLIYIGTTDLIYTGALTIDSNANIASRNARLTIPAPLPVTGTLTINNESVNDNVVVFTSPLPLTQTLNVQVGGGGGNGGVGVLTGLISGAFGINKTGNGILALGNNNNSFTGVSTVRAGTLAAGAPNAFGASTGGTVASNGASIGVISEPATGFPDFTLSPTEPLTFLGAGVGGNGALVNVQGNNKVAVPALTGNTTIGSLSGTLTIDSPINLTSYGVTFGGPGNVVVNGVISGNNTSSVVPGFVEKIFNGVVGNAQTDINAYINAGVGAADGSGVLTGNFDYPNDAAFSTRAAELGAVGFDNGDFSAVWTATFTPNAAGAWGFRFANVDDNASIWIDTDGTPGFQDTDRIYFRGCCGASGDQFTPDLVAGTGYRFGIALSDTGGGGYLTNVQFMSPTPTGYGAGNWVTINATTYPQAFRSTITANNFVNKTGSGTATLNAVNTYAGTTTVSGGTLSVATNGALSTTTAGTTVSSGGTLQFANVNYSTLEPVTLKGTGAVGGSGTSTFAGPINSPLAVKYANHQTAQPSPSSSIPIGGVSGRYLRVQQNLPDGADGWLSLAEVEILDSTGTNLALNGTATQISDYAAQGIAAKAIDGNTDGNWGGQSVTHTNTPNHNAWWQVDLGATATIDSVNIWNRTDCCSTRLRDYYVFISDVPFLPSDTIESLTLANAPSIGTAQAADSLTLTGSIAIVSTNANPVSLTFNGPGAVTANGVISGGNVVKSGTGSATLGAANTYTGNTTVTGGTLNTTASNALGNSFNTSTLTVSGATSVVNLFNNATAETKVGAVDFSAGTGTVNTGPLGGKLAIKTSLQLAGGYKVTGDMTAQGANLVDNAAQRTLSAVTGTLDVFGVPSPVAVVDNGTLFTNSSSATNTFSYTASTGADILVVAINSRSSNDKVTPTVSYNGVPLISAVTANSLTSTFINSHIFYLMNPPTGAARNLVVNFSPAPTSNYAIYAYTLKGVSTTATPVVASLNTEGSPTTRDLTLANLPAGAVGITTGNYRLGTSGPITSTATSGTSLVTGTGGGGGNFWTGIPSDTTIITHGALVTDLAAGSTTFTSTAAGAAGTRWVFVAAAFAPKSPAPAAVNLPATNFFLPTGTTLKVGGAGDSVIGTVSYAGNATVSPSAVAPASLTIGGTGGAGVGTLNTTSNLGLKLATGSSFKVDVNGATAGQVDLVNVNGAVNLTGATLNVTTGAGFTPTVGNTFTIISNDAADAVTGTFTGIAEGGVVFGGTSAYTVSYKGGDGNDVVLTATTAGAATTTTLVATPLATTGGSAVQFTATVGPSPGALGTVAFLDNGVAITGGANVPVVGGVATFSTTTLGTGSHPVTASYSGAAGFAPSTSNVQTVVVSAGGTAPAVNTITFNGGLTGFNATQRSRLINATVEFNQPVILDTNAMTLALHTNNVNYAGNNPPTGQPANAGVPATLTATPSTDSKTWTLTWSGANTEVGADQLVSLKDGVYDLVIDATKVHPVGSTTVNMAANSTTVFHRLFGDTNPPAQSGNDFTAILAGNDNLAFRGAFNKPVGGGYLPYMDSNGDGNINSGDNLAFRTRFNKGLTWTV